MMRYGIPGYRTPRDMLDAEIDRIIAHGASRCGSASRVGTRRRARGARARITTRSSGRIGAQKGRPLPVPGADARQLHHRRRVPRRVQPAAGCSRPRSASSWSAAATPRSTSPRSRAASATSGQSTRTTSAINEEFGHTAHDVAGTLAPRGRRRRCSPRCFPVEKMTAAEREREDAQREGVEDHRRRHAARRCSRTRDGPRQALRVCQCTMKGMIPEPIDGHRIRHRMRHDHLGDRPDGRFRRGAGAARQRPGRDRDRQGLPGARRCPSIFAGGDAHPPASADDRDRPGPHRRRDDRPTSWHGELGEQAPEGRRAPVQPARRAARRASSIRRPTTIAQEPRHATGKKFAVHNYEDRGCDADHSAHRAVQRPFRLCRARNAATSAMSTPTRCSAISPSASSPSARRRRARRASAA